MFGSSKDILVQFQPTLPLRGATDGSASVAPVGRVSTHAPLAGSDLCHIPAASRLHTVSTHAPLAGSDGVELAIVLRSEVVSTHAPLAGSDIWECLMKGALMSVSTHAPLAGSDDPTPKVNINAWVFQPTLPLRGATIQSWRSNQSMMFQPTLPLRGATLVVRHGGLRSKFQPTLPLRGATLYNYKQSLGGARFQPTLPLRGATAPRLDMARRGQVSTHAPLAGSDVEYRLHIA